ncbi:unnamed protein product [Ostreobium quekettii]|uniref:Leucine-rich repeat protein n=1 Tax=Ostreobium quekettii TaxID=121088 RepID=A0A8S1J890_9CHLO|nr:unnamed protein product [Ostreobium quekettii]
MRTSRDGGGRVGLGLAVAFLLLSALFSGRCQRSSDVSDEDVALLTEGKPIVGFLDFNEARIVRFGVTSTSTGDFPDILMTLIVTNALGDADIRCSPYNWVQQGRRGFPWVSTHRQGADEVFMSSKTEEYKAAVIDVEVNRTGVTETIQAVGFQCWVVGASRAGSAFELEADVAVAGVGLIGDEQKALRTIFADCCAKKGACKNWPRKGKKGIKLEFDLCHVQGNICDVKGRLTRLNMDGYGLGCEFPSREFSVFEDMRKQEVGRNKFTGDMAKVMDALATLVNLTHINVRDNKLSGTLANSKGLCEMTASRLQFLDVQSNPVHGPIPECLITSDSQLLDVILSKTDISGTIPDVFAAESNLQAFIARDARLFGKVPPSLANPEQLTFLELGANELTGRFPDGVEELPNIHTLSLQRNKISGLPKAWNIADRNNPTTLKFVDFGSNKIRGKFPLMLATVEHMDYLDLSRNKLKGTLPDAPGVFPNIYTLKLANNRFHGAIPDSWGAMGMFQVPPAIDISGKLDLRNNRDLSGELPDFFYPDELQGNVPEVRIDKTSIACDVRGPSPYVTDTEECKGDPAAFGARR